MKKKTKINLWMIVFVMTLLFFTCEEETPFTPSPPTPPEPEAYFVITGDIKRTYTSYHSPQFEGKVKNTGDATGYNVMVEITCYSDDYTTIIDNAHGFPGNLGNIEPGQKATFEAVAFECDSHDQIKTYDVTITWLTKSGAKMRMVYQF